MNYQEYKQLLNRELAKKVQREFDEFRKDILTKNPQEIYDSACQIVLKSDIAECFSKPNYSFPRRYFQHYLIAHLKFYWPPSFIRIRFLSILSCF